MGCSYSQYIQQRAELRQLGGMYNQKKRWIEQWRRNEIKTTHKSLGGGR